MGGHRGGDTACHGALCGCLLLAWLQCRAFVPAIPEASPQSLPGVGGGPVERADLRATLAAGAQLPEQGAHGLVGCKLEGHVGHILQQRGEVPCEQASGSCKATACQCTGLLSRGIQGLDWQGSVVCRPLSCSSKPNPCCCKASSRAKTFCRTCGMEQRCSAAAVVSWAAAHISGSHTCGHLAGQHAAVDHLTRCSKGMVSQQVTCSCRDALSSHPGIGIDACLHAADADCQRHLHHAASCCCYGTCQQLWTQNKPGWPRCHSPVCGWSNTAGVN